jgi:hypothetical protein
MKAGSMFPGSYLKAEDLGWKRVPVVIERVDIEKIGDDPKPVIHFVGKDRALVLNKTNASTITDVLGTDETDEWEGKRIVLYATKTEYQGKRVPCIRVAEPNVPTPPPPADDDDSDAVPF